MSYLNFYFDDTIEYKKILKSETITEIQNLILFTQIEEEVFEPDYAFQYLLYEWENFSNAQDIKQWANQNMGNAAYFIKNEDGSLTRSLARNEIYVVPETIVTLICEELLSCKSSEIRLVAEAINSLHSELVLLTCNAEYLCGHLVRKHGLKNIRASINLQQDEFLILEQLIKIHLQLKCV